MFGEVNVSSEVVVIDRDSWKGWVVPCAHSERREEDEKKLCVRINIDLHFTDRFAVSKFSSAKKGKRKKEKSVHVHVHVHVCFKK